MKKVQQKKFKKGAAAFYIVAMSAVVLVVLAVSFATVIISELTRTSNDDLAQSAYDSALAGVEDAKLAFANYRRCAENGAVPNLVENGTVECGDIMYWMQPEPGRQDCDMVARMIGRIGDKEPGREVPISDTTTTDGSGVSSNLNQAYTCVKMQTTLTDYRASLSNENRMRIIRPQFSDGVTANDITQVKFSWYTKRAGDVFFFNNFANVGTGYRTVFQPAGQVRTVIPPTMEIQMVQTGDWFSLDNLNGKSSGGSTDRATLYLVAAGKDTSDAVSDAQIRTAASNCEDSNNYYCGTYSGGSNGTNSISAAQVAATNDQVTNKPFVVYCGTGDDSEYACSVTINLPTPIEGSRSDETFVFLVTLPYGEPSTDFAMEFLCGASTPCGESRAHDDGSELTEADLITALDGVQIEIDSTGRANDVYRRVKTRLESSDESFPYPGYAVQLFGDGDGTIEKTMTVLREWNYYQ